MLIGVPKEIKNHEYRIGLTPAGARELVSHGHRLRLEQDVKGPGVDLGPFKPRPGIVMRVGGIDPADEIGGQAAFILQPVERFKRRRRNDPAKIEDDRLESRICQIGLLCYTAALTEAGI